MPWREILLLSPLLSTFSYSHKIYTQFWVVLLCCGYSDWYDLLTHILQGSFSRLGQHYASYWEKWGEMCHWILWRILASTHTHKYLRYHSKPFHTSVFGGLCYGNWDKSVACLHGNGMWPGMWLWFMAIHVSVSLVNQRSDHQLFFWSIGYMGLI